MRIILGVMMGLLLATVSLAQKRDAEFDKLADRYFDECVFKYDPVYGTQAGFHQYDALLPAGSRAEIDQADRHPEALRDGGRRVRRPGALTVRRGRPRTACSPASAGQLLTLEMIRPWEKNPDIYSSGVSNAIFVIMSRSFAPAAVRLRSVIAREKLIPRVFDSARANLKNPPQIYTEVAMEQMPGIVGFFQNDVPTAFKDVHGRAAPRRVPRPRTRASSTRSSPTRRLLKTDLLPRSNGDFRIGADTYRKKLLYDEMVDIPLDRLLQIGYARSASQPGRVQDGRRADRSDADAAQAILDEAQKDHPAARQTAREHSRTCWAACATSSRTHKIVTIPTRGPADRRRDAAVHARADHRVDGHARALREGREGSVLQRDAAGEDLDAKQTEEYWKASIAAPSSAPRSTKSTPATTRSSCGSPSAPSKVRKLLGCASNAEGWAHYTEQMMLDEGYGNGDLKLRLGQLQDALLRDARFIAGIQMHTGKMTVDGGRRSSS